MKCIFNMLLWGNPINKTYHHCYVRSGCGKPGSSQFSFGTIVLLLSSSTPLCWSSRDLWFPRNSSYYKVAGPFQWTFIGNVELCPEITAKRVGKLLILGIWAPWSPSCSRITQLSVCLCCVGPSLLTVMIQWHSPGWYPPLTFLATRTNVVAIPALAVLMMIAGCTSATTISGRWLSTHKSWSLYAMPKVHTARLWGRKLWGERENERMREEQSTQTWGAMPWLAVGCPEFPTRLLFSGLFKA